MRISATFAIAVSSILLVSCQQPVPETKSVKYYAENPVERKSALVRCRDLPTDASKNADCVNARQAELTAAAKAPTGTVDFKNTKVPR